jgi:hypothetical protein
VLLGDDIIDESVTSRMFFEQAQRHDRRTVRGRIPVYIRAGIATVEATDQKTTWCAHHGLVEKPNYRTKPPLTTRSSAATCCSARDLRHPSTPRKGGETTQWMPCRHLRRTPASPVASMASCRLSAAAGVRHRRPSRLHQGHRAASRSTATHSVRTAPLSSLTLRGPSSRPVGRVDRPHLRWTRWSKVGFAQRPTETRLHRDPAL